VSQDRDRIAAMRHLRIARVGAAFAPTGTPADRVPDLGACTPTDRGSCALGVRHTDSGVANPLAIHNWADTAADIADTALVDIAADTVLPDIAADTALAGVALAWSHRGYWVTLVSGR